MAITIGTGSISFDGTAFRAADISDLKAGKSIATDSDKKFVNSADTTTYIRMGTSAKAWHYINDQPVLKLGIGNISIGDGNTNIEIGTAGIGGGNGGVRTLNVTGSGGVTIEGPTILGSQGITGGMVVTGSTSISGSFASTGSFVVGNLLDLLANYGATGIPTGSGEGGVSVGDINLDGQVNINDLLLLLAGMGNPNILVSDLTIPQNTNYQLVGPEISVSQDVVVTVGTNSFLQIT